MSSKPSETAEALVTAAAELRDECARMTFEAPVACVYNPLAYAWDLHARYLRTWGASRREVLFLGMNPGPWGMAQVGVPFGEVTLVRDWLQLEGPVAHPAREHPKRPVLGFACTRSEVSGRRLWGFFRQRFGTPRAFFGRHFVANYCPLMFLEAGGRNMTPDRLPAHERTPLFTACDRHLRQLAEVMRPAWVIGVGGFAATRAAAALEGRDVRVGTVLHPSPASPRANRDWAGAVERQMQALGVWQTPDYGRTR